MRSYVCVECGFMGDFEDFGYGDCPCCGSEDVQVSERADYDLDQCLDLGEPSFDMGDF